MNKQPLVITDARVFKKLLWLVIFHLLLSKKLLSTLEVSFKLKPVMNVTYEGIRGRTQGDRKLNSPATKATAIPIVR